MWRSYLQLPRAVHLLCLGAFVNRMAAFVLTFLAFYLGDERGFDAAFATATLGAYGVGSMLASMAGGHLADRVGRRRGMLVALLGGAAVLVVFPFLRSGPAILASVFVYALLTDLYRPASQAMLADLVTPEERPRAYSLMYVAINLGFTASAVGGGLVVKFGYAWLFRLDALTSALFAGLILFAIPETLAPAKVEPNQAQADSYWAAMRHVLSNRPFLALFASTLAASIIFNQGHTTLPVYLHSLGHDAATYGRIVAVNGAMIVLFQLALTHWLTGRDRVRVLSAASVLVGLGFGLCAVVSSALAFAGTVVLWTLAEMLQAALYSPLVTELAPVRYRARYFGAFSLAFGGGMTLGPVVGGQVLEHLGAGWLWSGCFALGLFGAALVLFVDLKPQPEAAPALPPAV